MAGTTGSEGGRIVRCYLICTPPGKAARHSGLHEAFNELKKTKTKDYAVVACLSTKASMMRAGYNYSEGLYWVKDIKDDFEDRDDGMFTVMLFNVIEDFGRTPVFYAAF